MRENEEDAVAGIYTSVRFLRYLLEHFSNTL